MGKRSLAIFLVCLVTCPAQATSIIVLITHHDIVIGADGKLIGVDPKGEHIAISDTLVKVGAVGNRVLVAQSGMEKMPGDTGLEYSFETFVAELQATVGPKENVTKVVAIVKQRLSHPFPHLERLIAEGQMTPQALSPPTHDIVMTVIVAGFDDGKLPVVFTVQLRVDWASRKLETPTSEQVYPKKPPAKAKQLTLQGATNQGVGDLYGGVKTPVIIRELHRLPLEYEALAMDKDLRRGQLLLLDRSILDIEVGTSPEEIGYPLTVFVVSPTSVSYRQFKDLNDR